MVRPSARIALSLLAFALLAVPPGMTAQDDGTFTPQVPCRDEPLCPDLVVDPIRMAQSVGTEVRTFGATSCDVVEGHVPAPGTYKLLRWTYNTPNIGAGDLYVGSPSQHPEWFEYQPCHRHHHFREYADYRLWTVEGFTAYAGVRLANPTLTFEELLAANPGLASGFRAGNKGGFCVIDLTLAFGPVGFGGNYFSCNDQGISVGFADEYHRGLSGQWIIVDGVPAGAYVLENEVNAERMFKESSYENNWWAVPIRIA